MFDEARLRRHIAAYFDQQLGADEKFELETMLRGSSKARRIFIEEVQWHGMTREWALRASSTDVMHKPVPPRLQPAVKPGGAGRIIAMVAGMAACLALGWGILHLRKPGPAEEVANGSEAPPVIQTFDGDGEVASLGLVNEVEWDEAGVSYKVGSALPKGWLHIRKGTLRVDFYSGACVFLEGPASFELISPFLARLESGRLTAAVPPPAEGFTVLSENLRVIDRGTEFGMNVKAPGDCEVHVFNGEVELQGEVPVSAARELREGDALSIRDGKASPIPLDRRSFTDAAAQSRAASIGSEALWQSWRKSSEVFRSTPDLLLYYDFEHLERNVVFVPNRALNPPPDSAGSIISCDRLPGRWEGKTALGFASKSDRIRFRLSGEVPSLTMMAWVRVDSLPFDHNALLSMSPEQMGEIHWKLDRSGSLLVGLRASMDWQYQSWERLESPPIVSEENFGRWMHLATVIDGGQGVMKHFVNGGEVASGRMKHPSPVRLGLANIGNFDASSPAMRQRGYVRSFNGRIDEFSLIGRALGEQEIRDSMR